MKKQVFIINGSGGVGKDTFVSFVQKYSAVMNISAIDEVKYFAKMMGWNGKKDLKGRRFLSELKRILIEYNNRPFIYLQECVDMFLKDSESEFCFLHIREPEEITKAKETFGAKTILITRDTIEQVKGNDSDERVLDYDYDIHIMNNSSLEHFEIMAKDFVNKFKGGVNIA